MKNKFVFLRFFGCFVFLSVFIHVHCVELPKKFLTDENRDETGEGGDESKDENLSIPVELDQFPFPKNTCRRSGTSFHAIRDVNDYTNYPFMAAVMSNGEYVCSGSALADGLFITTAKCAKKQAPSHILVNVTKAVKDDTAVVLNVKRTEEFPTFVVGKDNTNNVAVIYTEKIPKNSNILKLLTSNISMITNNADVEAFGFGLNTKVDATKTLQSVSLEVRGQKADKAENLLKVYFDCVDTFNDTCFKDVGGPVIVDEVLVGIMVEGTTDCVEKMTSQFTLNKQMGTFLPIYTFKNWLDDKILKHVGKKDLNPFPEFLASRRASRPKDTTERALYESEAIPTTTPEKIMILLLGSVFLIV